LKNDRVLPVPNPMCEQQPARKLRSQDAAALQWRWSPPSTGHHTRRCRDGASVPQILPRRDEPLPGEGKFRADPKT